MLVKTGIEQTLMDSAKEVFETMIFMDITASDESKHVLDGQTLMGMITFSGDIEGCLSFCCTKQCAAAITANMLGLEETGCLSESELKDTIGEISNMILGSFKTKAEAEVGTITLSIPTVVVGRELDNDMVSKNEKTLLKINLQDEYFAETALHYRKVK